MAHNKKENMLAAVQEGCMVQGAPQPAPNAAPEEGGSDESDAEADEGYEVEKLLAKAKDDAGSTIFKVRWKGYGPQDDTWEPREELMINARLKVIKFERDVRHIHSVLSHP